MLACVESGQKKRKKKKKANEIYAMGLGVQPLQWTHF